jgi:DNA-binding NarL/FixJ family response regulator
MPSVTGLLMAGTPTGGDRPGRGRPPVLVVEGRELFATCLRITLEARGFDTHQASLSNRDAILDHARDLRPGVVLLDLDLRSDGGQAIDGVDLIRARGRLGAGVLVVSDSRDQLRSAAAIAAGAVGLVHDTAPLAHLLNAVRAAGTRRPIMPEEVRQAWLRLHEDHRSRQRERTRQMALLTSKELEVLRLLAQGTRAIGIAEHFVVSVATVRSQIQSILAKLEVKSQLEAVALHNKQMSVSDAS